MMTESNQELCVRLFRDNQILTRCKANYVDFSGINIDANPMLLPKGSEIDVVISLGCKKGEVSCTLHSVVTTRSSSGVGLTFTGNDNDFSVLRDILMHIDGYRVAG